MGAAEGLKLFPRQEGGRSSAQEVNAHLKFYNLSVLTVASGARWLNQTHGTYTAPHTADRSYDASWWD